MKVKIIPQRCIACGLCQTYSSEFHYDDDGIVRFDHDEQAVKEFAEDNQILRAIKECPTKAIVLD